MKISLSRIAVVAVFSLFATAASQAAIEAYNVHGTVQQVDTANRKITLSQDSVTELGWPVRTMTYKVNSDKVLMGVKPGDSIDATFTADSPYQPAIHFISPAAK